MKLLDIRTIKMDISTCKIRNEFYSYSDKLIDMSDIELYINSHLDTLKCKYFRDDSPCYHNKNLITHDTVDKIMMILIIMDKSIFQLFISQYGYGDDDIQYYNLVIKLCGTSNLNVSTRFKERSGGNESYSFNTFKDLFDELNVYKELDQQNN